MLKYMLDTNICIFTLKNRPAHMRDTFKRHSGQMCISTVVLTELIHGAERSANPQRNLAEVESFTARLEVLNYDCAAATHSGQLRAELASARTLIGPYDLLIAGHARSLGLILVTNNRREFDRAPGLRVEDWVAATTSIGPAL